MQQAGRFGDIDVDQPFGVQFFDETLPREATGRLSSLEPHHVRIPRGFDVRICILKRQLQEGHARKLHGQLTRVLGLPSVEGRQLTELGESDGDGQWMSSVLQARTRQRKFVEGMIGGYLHLASLVVVAEDQLTVVEVRVLGQGDAALAASDDLLSL